MPTIKNIGKRARMVADRILQPGEAKYITVRQAQQYDGIPDFEIVDETPVQAKPVVASQTGQGDPAPTKPSPQPSPKGRGGKARGKKK